MTFQIGFRALLGFLVASFSLLTCAETGAETVATNSELRWDCWISTDETRTVVSYMIRCINDRTIANPDPAPESPPGILLDMIHEHIHHGEALEIDRDIAAGRLAEVARYVRQVRIHQYPYEESWNQGRPKVLVESVLCRGASTCSVVLNR